MKVTVFGLGYVGLVQAAVLADLGNHVVCRHSSKEGGLGAGLRSRQKSKKVVDPRTNDQLI